MLGAPLEVVKMLFPELSHIVSPEEALEKGFFTKLHGDYQDATAHLKELEAEDQELIKNHKNPVNSQTSWFGYGKSKIDIARERQQKALTAYMDAIAARIGISTKYQAIPPPRG